MGEISKIDESGYHVQFTDGQNKVLPAKKLKTYHHLKISKGDKILGRKFTWFEAKIESYDKETQMYTVVM